MVSVIAMTGITSESRDGSQARKTFKIAWEPECPSKIAFEHFEVKPTPITLINLVLRRKGPLKKKNTLFLPISK